MGRQFCRTLLVAVLGVLAAQAPEAAARKQKPSQPANTTFPSCNTGTSRIVLANMDKLSAECRPAHHHIAVAIYACFATSKVKVERCQVTVHAAGKAAKTNPVCKAFHAQGVLQGPSNASLVAVINQAKFMKFAKEQPGVNSSTAAAAMQQMYATTLAQLFGRTVVLQGKSRCSAAAGTGHKGKDGKGSKSSSSSSSGDDAAAAEGAVPGRRRPGRRKRGPGTAAAAGNGTVGAAGNVTVSGSFAPAAVPTPSNDTAAGSHNSSVSSTASNSSSSAIVGASGSNSTAAANSSSANATSTAAVPAAAAAAQPGKQTGHRRLMWLDIGEWQSPQRPQQQLPRHLLENATKAATAGAGADKSCRDGQASYDPEADFRAALANSSSSVGNQEGSLLYLQGANTVILQPSQQCRFQYLVTKNPSLLQPTGKPSVRATAVHAPAAAAAATRREGAGGAAASAGAGAFGHVAWIAFSSVSVVLGVVVCYMMVKLVARRSDLKRYDALQTSEPGVVTGTTSGAVQLVPTAAAGDQQDQQQRPSSAGMKAVATAPQELPDSAGRGDKSRLLKDNRRSDGSSATGR